MKIHILVHACRCGAVLLLAGAAHAGDWFAAFERVADYQPKGPSQCFRQFNIDWSWIALRPEQLPEFLSEADPAALAEFCRQTHIDGTVVMAVPHHGYCTYETRLGAKFPGMKGDWFGRTIEELHKRRIAAFGYVTLNWNWKFIRDNLGRDFIQGRPDADGVCSSRCMICLNAPGYLELVEGYTREVLENYPVDGMRWDILMTAQRCACEGCRKLYRETYGEELAGWERAPAGRAEDFYIATTSRAVTRLQALCKRLKPGLEIWQNCLQSYHPNDLDLARRMDVGYNEYGDPFRLLFIRGVADKLAAINGLMNKTPAEPPRPLDREEWRTCLALGGRCYSYYGHKQTNPRTLLPGEAMPSWHREQLAPFYGMVSRIEPWLQGAVPVSHVGVVFSERTRFRFPGYDRKPYIDALEAITRASLQRSDPVEFVHALDLGHPAKNLARLNLLVLPLTSGLSPGELQALLDYAGNGGTVLVAGDALRHDERGREQKDFALAAALGVSYRGSISGKVDLPATLPSGAPAAGIRNAVRIEPSSGQTQLTVTADGLTSPLLHITRHGKGRLAYLASLDSPELTRATIEQLSGTPPLQVEGAGHRAFLTRQPLRNRWVIHLITNGDCTLRLSRAHVPVSRVTAVHPQGSWTCAVEPDASSLRIRVTGNAPDRLLVVE